MSVDVPVNHVTSSWGVGNSDHLCPLWRQRLWYRSVSSRFLLDAGLESLGDTAALTHAEHSHTYTHRLHCLSVIRFICTIFTNVLYSTASQLWANPNRDLNTFGEWFNSLKIRFGNRRLGFDSIRYFLLFDLGREIRQPNHCWLLLISPFQCLVVSPVEITGFSCKQLR